MSKIAPTLQAFARVCDTHCLMLDEVEPLRRELRALLAVWSSAKAMAVLTRSSVDKGEQVCLTEVHLMLAVERAERRVSSRPSTVEGNRKLPANSSRPGRGRAK